jgi:hypothetical protein
MYIPERAWTAKLDCNFDRASVWEGSKQIAEVYGAYQQDREDIGNLLASAPALYNACQIGLTALKRIPTPDEAEEIAMQVILGALRKAEGRE